MTYGVGMDDTVEALSPLEKLMVLVLVGVGGAEAREL